jgi:hypothetical protein
MAEMKVRTFPQFGIASNADTARIQETVLDLGDVVLDDQSETFSVSALAECANWVDEPLVFRGVSRKGTDRTADDQDKP